MSCCRHATDTHTHILTEITGSRREGQLVIKRENIRSIPSMGYSNRSSNNDRKAKRKKKKEKQEKLAKISSFLQHFLRLLVSCFLIFFGWSFGFLASAACKLKLFQRR